MKAPLLLIPVCLMGCFMDEAGLSTVHYGTSPGSGAASGSSSGAAGVRRGSPIGSAMGGTTASGWQGSVPLSQGGGKVTSLPGATGGTTEMGVLAGTTSVGAGGTDVLGAAGNLAGGASGTTGPGQPGGAIGTTSTGVAGAGGGNAGALGNLDAGAAGTPARDAGDFGGAADTRGTGGSIATCEPAGIGGPEGMKTGQDCLSCHTSGKGPRMTVAGTLYASAGGGQPVVGATITITDSTGKKIKMITGKEGNFYATNNIAFPATVEASKCPDTVPMIATVTSGACNSCHNSKLRMHLP